MKNVVLANRDWITIVQQEAQILDEKLSEEQDDLTPTQGADAELDWKIETHLMRHVSCFLATVAEGL